MTNRVGQHLGNYRLTHLLGQGGFAEVYLGQHVYLETQAAIKVLHTALAEENIEQFRGEARTIANLTHMHIIRVLEFGIENNVPFLAMDYAPDGTLRGRHPRGRRVQLPSVVSYVKQVASALQYAHDKRLIHRDIKPENMLLNQQQVMLSDFGIALATHSSRYQSPQQIAGTAAYMAPEQLQGHARRASDQYALAVVVYEWLCGELPFRGSFQEIASQHCLVRPPSLCEKVPTLAPEIEQVVLTALAKDPEQRFGCIQDFADAFEQVSKMMQVGLVEGMIGQCEASPFSRRDASKKIDPQLTNIQEKRIATTILPPQTLTPDISLPPTKPTWGHSKTIPASKDLSLHIPEVPDEPGSNAQGFSRRVLIRGLGAIGVLAVSGGVGWEALPRMSSLYHQFVPLYTYRGHSDNVTSVAWFPDGKRIVSSGLDQTGQIWDAFDGGHAILYRGVFDKDDDITEGITFAARSPNGKLIASGGIGNIVQVWDALDGGHVYTYRGHRQPIASAAWSPDGKRIASGGGSLGTLQQDNTVQVWDALDGGHVYTYRGHAQAITSVAWSPDGKCIASASLDHTVQVWNAFDGGHIYTYHGHSTAVYIAAVAWSPDSKRIVSAGGDDGTVQVWDAATGGHVYVYNGHSNPSSSSVNSAAWSPDGKRIASGGSDNTVQIWDALDGDHVYTYHGHSHHVASVAWSPDGKYIASGSFDYTVQICPAG